MTDEQMIESNRQQLLEEQQAEEFLASQEEWDEPAMTAEERKAIDDNIDGNEAGRAFAHRHILAKINTFIDVYRSKKYSENFIEGFIEGVNDVTGGFITLDSETEEVDNPS